MWSQYLKLKLLPFLKDMRDVSLIINALDSSSEPWAEVALVFEHVKTPISLSEESEGCSKAFLACKLIIGAMVLESKSSSEIPRAFLGWGMQDKIISESCSHLG